VEQKSRDLTVTKIGEKKNRGFFCTEKDHENVELLPPKICGFHGFFQHPGTLKLGNQKRPGFFWGGLWRKQIFAKRSAITCKNKYHLVS
jgi:hypothetical protein